MLYLTLPFFSIHEVQTDATGIAYLGQCQTEAPNSVC